jgi:hypothetical protein
MVVGLLRRKSTDQSLRKQRLRRSFFPQPIRVHFVVGDEKVVE